MSQDDIQPPKKRSKIRFILAVDAWKKSASILANRASFPLLRRVITQERDASFGICPFSNVDSKTLIQSAKAHLFLLVAMTPLSLWSILVTTKGLAALIKFGSFTTWLFMGAPLVVMTGIKIYISYVSRRSILAELQKREITEAQKNASI